MTTESPAKSSTVFSINAKHKYSHLFLFTLLMLCTSLTAWATDYVIVYDDDNFLSYNNGIANATAFNPVTCIWTCYNGATATSLSKNDSYSLRNGTNNYLNGSTTNGDAISRSGTAKNNWRTDGSDRLIYRGSGNNYYAYYRGSSWRTSRSSDPNYNNRNNETYYNGYGNPRPDYRATVYAVTTSDVPGSLSAPGIAGSAVINTTTTQTYTASGSEYTEAHKNYNFNDEDHFMKTDGSAPGKGTDGITYTYSLSANSYATVNASTGVLTVTSLPASGSVKLTLTVTASKSGYTSATATKEIYLTREDHVTETGQYVICSNNQYWLGGTNTNRLSAFDPATCLWTGTSGGKWQNSGGGWLYNNATFISTDNSSNFTLGGTESGTTGRTISSGDNYIRYSNNQFERSNSTWNTTRRNVVFAVTKTTYKSTEAGELTITGADVLNATGLSSAYTHNTLTSQDDYVDYVFYNGNHHYFDTDGNSINAAPLETFTYVWSMTGANGHATIDATSGVINYSLSTEADLPVTVTLTATGNKGTTRTATKTVTLKPMPRFWFTVKTVASPAEGGTATVRNASNAQVTEYTFSAFGTSQSATSATATISLTATASSAAYRWQSWTGVTANAATASNVSVTSTSKSQASPTVTTATANFEKAPTFYLRAEAVADPAEGGTVTASIDGGSASATATASKEGDFGTHYTYQTFNLSYTATPAASYTFEYWHDGAGNTLSTSTTYSVSNVRATSKDEANPTVNRVYAKFSTLPTSISVDTLVVGVGASGQNSLVVNLLPAGSVKYLKFLIDASDAYAFVDEATGLVTGKKAGQTTVTVIAYENAAKTIEACRDTGVIIVRDVCKVPVITFTPIDEGFTATTTLSCETEGATLYYQIKPDGGDRPTEWTVYTASFTVNDKDRVYTYADKPDDDKFSASKETNLLYSSHKVATPTISISSTGSVTFDCADEPDVTYYYTTDGSTPTTSSSSWTSGSSAISGLPNETEVKVMATKAGCRNSDVAGKTVYFSGISGDTVYLNDYEDHAWTYYSGVDASIDGGHYNTSYLGKLYSPDPRNVKITYRATDGAAVSIDEDETSFVYYKTIEKADDKYTYQVISSPFSKRPTGKGFGGWKLVSISNGATISGHSVNDVLSLDETLTLTLPDAGVNGTSTEIVFETTWADANITRRTSTGAFTYSVTGGNYETNILVLQGSQTGTITTSSPVTIMMVEPDGSDDYRDNYTFTGNVSPNNDAVTKIEYARWRYNGSVYTNHRSLTIGRGIDMANNFANGVYGNPNTSGTTSGNLSYTIKIESGKTNNLYLTNASESSNRQIKYSGTLSARCILGCDYDRAAGNNSNMSLATSGSNSAVYGGKGLQFTGSGNQNNLTFDWTIKSGTIMSGILGNADGGTQSIYMGASIYNYDGNSLEYFGRRRMTIEGGDMASVAGGVDDIDRPEYLINDGDWTVMVRVKGGNVRGSIYGAAAQAGSAGDRLFVFTGGSVHGWVAGGANGTQSDGGVLDGATRLYIGGNTSVNSNGAQTVINRAVGGNVFGAGCGYSTTSSSGQVTEGTNVVIADNAYIERGVYGGGSYGYCSTDQDARVYVTGGHVGGVNGGVNGASYSGSITGGIFGGACQNRGGSSIMYMTDGLVEGGLYGGSNSSGTLSGSVSLQITGGQVGLDATHKANIHGGGYGSSTVVSKDVDIVIGTYDATTKTTSGDAVIYGDVYGGSALGKVNGSTATNTYHTNVSLNAGTLYGSLYGGALGNATTAANVYGPVQVTVRGGSVKGEGNAIYGCNNVNGAPQRAVAVDIWNTDPSEIEGDYAVYAVFGGGNQANYNGTPSVTVHNCDNSIEYVYGGGNAATVTGTDVLIEGGNVLGNVFGGGYGANVNGDINLTITGGHILNAFGGNNNSGAVTGEIYITVAQSAPTCDESAQHASGECPVDIDKLCGGGNMAASNVAHIDIGCCDHIGTVYGGAEAANMTGDIDLQIKAGNIETVFGGNNQSGTIYGDITVTANWDTDTYTCESSLGTVYGGGNLAEYTGNTTVNILNCEMSGNVFGGGKGTRNDGTGAHVVGNTAVNIGDWKNGHSVSIGGSVFGGGDEAAVEGYTSVTIRDCATLIEGDVYGGGNAAPVYGTHVTVWGGSIYGNVFGGGNGQDLSKPGANVGYNRSNVRSTSAEGNAVTAIYGGTLGEPDGEGGFVENTGGVFGGSNSRGDIKGAVDVTLDSKSEAEVQTADERSAWGTGTKCTLDIQEAYGAGNVAEFNGQSITFTLGCIDAFKEIYGGAKNANLTSDIHLIVTSGHFKRVFAGNNIGGCLKGSLKVTVDEIGCNPLIIDALYGGGNRAAYSVYGYNDDGTVRTAADTGGEKVYSDPEVEVISCTHIGNIYGAGEGNTAIVVGDPKVFIDQIPGIHSEDAEVASYVNDEKLGSIANIYGGGNAADVKGDTYVNIGTRPTQAHLEFDPGTRLYTPGTETSAPGANIIGNVYGGGNAAKVEGQTHVQVGQ